MLENEIIPLYYAKNSKGYSPEWVQYIKRSIAKIAPHFTMKRMIDDYIARFYNPEAARFARLDAKDKELAKSIVAWKERVAAAWDGIKVFDVRQQSGDLVNGVTGDPYSVEIIIDTNGLGKDLGVEEVIYRVHNGEEELMSVTPFKVAKVEGNVLTYTLKAKIKDAGVFRYGYRLYPINADLPHREDFAFTRWV